MIEPFSDEQIRVLVNLQQRYDTWMSAERELAALPYGMKWKTVSGRDYLYRVVDRLGNGTSLGPRGEATEAAFAQYQEEKARLQDLEKNASASLTEIGRLYRALHLPMIPSDAAEILREADRRRLLGDHLLVIGTNAMPAYNIEAGGFIDTPNETLDFDFARSSREPVEGRPILAMLKAVDSTYTVNTERTFQVRNSKAHEVDFLVAPSIEENMPKGDGPSAFALPEQEWLLNGKYVDRVVVARDGSPARIVAPDPRWFSLQKIWLSGQEKRNALKRSKDLTQGLRLLDVVTTSMPQFPLDDDFASSLPEELVPSFEQWKEDSEAKPRTRGWR